MSRSLLGTVLLAFCTAAVGATQACAVEEDGATEDANYTTSGECDGLPKVALDTPPGVCVGVVMQGPKEFVTPGTDLRFPRGLTELPNGDLMLADMGSFGKDLGTIWLLKKQGKTFRKELLNKEINMPSGIAFNPGDGFVYVGTPDIIFRIDPKDTRRPAKIQVIIDKLPAEGRHPLKHFVFDPNDPKVLYVNVGSTSDVCEQGTGASATFPLDCPEEDFEPFGPDQLQSLDQARRDERRLKRSGIRRYDLRDWEAQPADANGRRPALRDQFRVVAKGLRNSMALAIHPTSGLLVQGENSRDAINKRDPNGTPEQDADLPLEELNVIGTMSELATTRTPKHFGWPYCHSNGEANPEYEGRVDCSKFVNPTLSLPPHVAPLGMRYYTGSMFPAEYRNQLIVGYHGFRQDGHRLVMVPVDAQGKPGAGEPRDIIRGWVKKGPNDPQGAPVDVMVAKDGSIYLTEDKNRTILRVFFDPSKGNGKTLTPLPRPPHVVDPEEAPRCADMKKRVDAKDPFALIEKNIIDIQCANCHGIGPGFPGNVPLKRCDDKGNAAALKPFVTPGDPNSKLIKILKGDGVPRMPADGLEEDEIQAITDWVMSLPK